jgi:hypothetical protein
MPDIEIRTMWRTAREQCELVWGQFTGYRLHLWVNGQLILNEAMADVDAAFSRASELRVEWPLLVE